MPTKKTKPHGALWQFLLPSLLGIIIFIVPTSYHGEKTILLAHLSRELCSCLTEQMPYLLALLLIGAAVLSSLATLVKPSWVAQHRTLAPLFIVKPLSLGLRLASAILSLLLLLLFCGKNYFPWKIPDELNVLKVLLPILFSNLLLSSFLAPLLLQFGLLEFIGILLTPIMRTCFLLPGRAAVNCVASWIGDGTVGTVMAIREYEEGKYTEKEASIVITSFAAVSLTFYTTILGNVGLTNHFGLFCLTTMSSSLLAALLLARIPPLSRKRSQYIKEGKVTSQEKNTPPKGSSWQRGLNAAMQRASTAPSLSALLKKSTYGVLELITNILPSVLLISFSSLLLANKCPWLLEGIGKPFIPLLEALGVAEAKEASQCLWIGFTDMVTPSMLAHELIQTPQTRFIIASLSVTQIIYLSELGSLLFGQKKLRITLWDLLFLFLLRTLLTLPIIVAFTHLFFG